MQLISDVLSCKSILFGINDFSLIKTQRILTRILIFQIRQPVNVVFLLFGFYRFQWFLNFRIANRLSCLHLCTRTYQTTTLDGPTTGAWMQNTSVS